jgi:phosphate:Na+ symporter
MFETSIKLLFGLALFFISIKLWGGALKSLDPKWISPIDNPWIMFGLALLTTIAVQSSSITTAAMVVIASTGSISLAAAIGGIIGANVGTTVTAWVTLLFVDAQNIDARHIATAHSLLNIGMAMVALPMAPYIAVFIKRYL